MGPDELTRVNGSPEPTVHRALGALRRAGLADQDAGGRHVLGDEFLRLAFTHHDARPEHVRVPPVLEAPAHRFGETARYAVLDGREVVQRAKVAPPTGAVKLTSTIGGRNPAHPTAVGERLLGRELTSLEEVRAWVGDVPPERRTPRTLCTATDLHTALAAAAVQGYACDDQENEPGVHRLALPVYLTSPTTPSGAVSISALAHRTPLTALVDALDGIRALLGPPAAPPA
ncbi:hypothetical protein GCM10027075_06800 [Streptomyces heilongjiangensis]